MSYNLFSLVVKKNEKCACIISLHSAKTNVESDMQNQVFFRKIKWMQWATVSEKCWHEIQSWHFERIWIISQIHSSSFSSFHPLSDTQHLQMKARRLWFPFACCSSAVTTKILPYLKHRPQSLKPCSFRDWWLRTAPITPLVLELGAMKE